MFKHIDFTDNSKSFNDRNNYQSNAPSKNIYNKKPTNASGFEVSGPKDCFTYENGVVKVIKGTGSDVIEVKNVDKSTATSDRIEINCAENVNLMLAGVNINSTFPIDIVDDTEGEVILTLKDDCNNNYDFDNQRRLDAFALW